MPAALLAALLCGAFLIWGLAGRENERVVGEETLETVEPAAMEIRGLEMRQGEDGVELWRLKARNAVMPEREGEIIAFDPFLTYFYQNETIIVQSDQGELDQKSNRISFTGRVRVMSGQDILLADRLLYEGNERKLYCPDLSTLERAGLSGRSNEFALDLDELVWRGTKGVSVDLEILKPPSLKAE
ncbi:MAG: LPS export ABC transporter periplasmic protein LptC [Desulfovibrionaceae bacterium]|nr:LPS export ABC transporter periplasmic protein LptC [Desulfovibrionaceae bacterium]